MRPLETYLRDLWQVRASGAGVPETSNYAALSNLLNEVGKELTPRVGCILQLANRGAGNPDGGLFTADQFQSGQADPQKGQAPARGVIEVKPSRDDAWVTADAEQVTRYWTMYRQVLVTNLRDFVLVGQDSTGRPVKLETYRLADSESAFWSAAATPQKTCDSQGERFEEFLKRMMLHGATLATPQLVAWFLASYAREARSRIETAELNALTSIREALEEALGLHFEGEKGDHFFRSTLVQTLFYGIFSAWILWSRHNAPQTMSRFSWRETPWWLHVPIIRALYEQVATPSKLGPLRLVEVLDWTESTLNRVDRDSFFARFEQDRAVQYFYEPFLEAFDPALRKELGVWYTPSEVVQYMVARVDKVLRDELHLPDGLADPNVYVLDPCTGTGSYLVEVLKQIEATLKSKGEDALVAYDVKQAAMTRIFGFEILPAPFVVAHMQLGLMLQNLGAPFSESQNERAGVYLTNALTGWKPLDSSKEQAFQAMLSGFPELLNERDQAREVKQGVPILVVLGNPPYNAFSGVSPEEEQGLVEPYKVGLIDEWNIKRFNLDDLYVRFFRLAERRIAENTGKGIVCFISNFSYLGGPSFVVMRRSFLSEFDSIWIDCLNGDSRETGKLTPEGKPDPSVFSTQYNREGIRVGTAVTLMVRRSQPVHNASVYFRQFWGASKRSDLVASLQAEDQNAAYIVSTPTAANRFSFRPIDVTQAYLGWPSISELAEFVSLGILENRKDALIDVDCADIEARMRTYFDTTVDWNTLSLQKTGLTLNAARFDARKARSKLLAAEAFNGTNIRRVMVRPMDQRWCYYTSVRPIWNEPRPAYFEQCWVGNAAIVSRRKGEADPEGVPFFFSGTVGLQHAFHKDAYFFPIQLRPSSYSRGKQSMQSDLFAPATQSDAAPSANISSLAREYLSSLGIANPDADAEAAGLLWMHVLAIGYAPLYREENERAIRQNWPRVPLPESADSLLASAALGKRVAELLDTERSVESISVGSIRSELRHIAVLTRVGGGALNPDAGDLALTAGWGHVGSGGATMPGKGKLVERDYETAELAAIEEGAATLGVSGDKARARLGDKTFDVYLNDQAYWKNVPARAWEYTIGGYQRTIKKWLSYRELPILGRALHASEAREVIQMARRIAALLLMEDELDRNYQAVKASAYEWLSEETASLAKVDIPAEVDD